MSKKVVLFLAEGFEEVEAVTPIDYLRRAGIEVITAALVSNAAGTVTGSHGISMLADTSLPELSGSSRLRADAWDAVLLPGGMPGASNLAASKELGTFLKEMAAAGKLVSAICASPAVALFPLGLLEGKHFTCFPGMEKQVSGALWLSDPVVCDGNIITSRAAGVAGLWAAALIEKLAGRREAGDLKERVLLQ
ncbi:MAG: DJ-1/PfpI family protein [Treponema sp.]|jgi:4-methyl-5(b-hydroxyethyl)-thiazole monophosphate biosynthesis|nr:DJ-1/PfpI family protein [Treponema sp.]